MDSGNFDSDTLTGLLFTEPKRGMYILKKQVRLNSIFLVVVGGLLSVPFMGPFIGLIAWLCLIFSCRTLVAAWCTYKNIARFKRLLLNLAWHVCGVGAGIGVGFVVKVILEKTF
ncbi:MAG: hypothetical protein FWD16_01270 [Clostridia bacterium]|nr:hypothetical protein [Clostridia bacterium]